jgi:hypothetical protein
MVFLYRGCISFARHLCLATRKPERSHQMQRLYFDHMGRYMEVSVGGHFGFMERPKDLK